METRFPESPNHRLVNLMTIARHHVTEANNAAVNEELMNGTAMLLVPAEPPERPGTMGVTFTHAPVINGVRHLFAFTGEQAVLTFATEDICCQAFPAGLLLRHCMGCGIGVIVVDPNTPNEVCLELTPPQAD